MCVCYCLFGWSRHGFHCILKVGLHFCVRNGAAPASVVADSMRAHSRSSLFFLGRGVLYLFTHGTQLRASQSQQTQAVLHYTKLRVFWETEKCSSCARRASSSCARSTFGAKFSLLCKKVLFLRQTTCVFIWDTKYVVCEMRGTCCPAKTMCLSASRAVCF